MQWPFHTLVYHPGDFIPGVGNEVEHTKPLMIASHENALTLMEHLKDKFKSIRIQKTAESISTKMSHSLD